MFAVWAGNQLGGEEAWQATIASLNDDPTAVAAVATIAAEFEEAAIAALATDRASAMSYVDARWTLMVVLTYLNSSAAVSELLTIASSPIADAALLAQTDEPWADERSVRLEALGGLRRHMLRGSMDAMLALVQVALAGGWTQSHAIAALTPPELADIVPESERHSEVPQ